MDKKTLIIIILVVALLGVCLFFTGYFFGGRGEQGMQQKSSMGEQGVEMMDQKDIQSSSAVTLHKAGETVAFEIPSDFPEGRGKLDMGGWVFVGKVISLTPEKLIFDQEVLDASPIRREIPVSSDVVVTFQNKDRDAQDTLLQSGEIVPTTPQDEALGSMSDVHKGSRVSVAIWKDKGVTSISLLD